MLPFGVTIPATVPQGSEIPEGLTNNPVYSIRQSRSLQADSRPYDRILGVLRNSEVRCRLRQQYESSRLRTQFLQEHIFRRVRKIALSEC